MRAIIFILILTTLSLCCAIDSKQESADDGLRTIKLYNMGKLTYPYIANEKRTEDIKSKITLIKVSMKKEEVLSLLPEPDFAEVLYSHNKGNSYVRGYRISYVISQNKEKGTIKEQGYKGFSVDFNDSSLVVSVGDLAEYKYFEIANAYIGKTNSEKYDIEKMEVRYNQIAYSCLSYCDRPGKECDEKKKKMNSAEKYIAVFLNVSKRLLPADTKGKGYPKGGGHLRVYIEEDTDTAVCAIGIK